LIMNRNPARPISAREWGTLSALIRENNLPKFAGCCGQHAGSEPHQHRYIDHL
jgi:hypothetical protein